MQPEVGVSLGDKIRPGPASSHPIDAALGLHTLCIHGMWILASNIEAVTAESILSGTYSIIDL